MFMLCLLEEDEEDGAQSCGEAVWRKELGHLQFVFLGFKANH